MALEHAGSVGGGGGGANSCDRREGQRGGGAGLGCRGAWLGGTGARLRRLEVDIQSFGIEMDQIPIQTSISIELQYQSNCLDVDRISTWNFMC